MYKDLVTKGNKADTLYKIVSANVPVLIKGASGKVLYIANKTNGDQIGQMSLHTGEPITATVQSITDMDIIVLNKK